jgi:cobalamin biosynthesis protein CobT
VRNILTALSPSKLLIIALAGLAMLASCGSDDSTEPAATTLSNSSVSESDGSAENSDTTDAKFDATDNEAVASDSEEDEAETDSDSEEAQGEADSDYPPFSDIDPATSPFFSTIEQTDLVERLGEEEVYEWGLTICRYFDDGMTLDGAINRLMVAGFGDDTAVLTASAVVNICPDHFESVFE